MKTWNYRHYKWGLYEVIWTAKHSENLEDFVIYNTLYENDLSKTWIRPKSMFEELIKVNGINIPRFKYIWNEDIKNT